VLSGTAIIAAAAAVFAPYLYAELWPWQNSFSRVAAEPPKLAAGLMFDDYFVVQDLGASTFAIGEPRYYQLNYSYLILGETRALLFDAGSGTRNMRPVVDSLTQLPVTVIPSHLHFDHLGGISAFDRLALIDLEETRTRVRDGMFKPRRYDFLGMFDGLPAPAMEVSEWLQPGSSIDLGGRSLTVISTPGHTSQSVSLLDSRAGWFFTGDFIYPTMLYAFLPGASISAYRQTTGYLLSTLPADTKLWTAHCCRRDEDPAAPWLTIEDLQALDQVLVEMEAGRADYEGIFPRRYPVNGQMILGTGFQWNNQ